MKSYRPYAPEQPFLLPPSPTEWLPDGHLVYFVLGFIDELDIGEIESKLQAKDARGERSYAPRMMTALLLYGYATGVFSSRRLERATVEDVAFRVLAGGAQPHFTTINAFRATHREALAGLFVQVLHACQSAGLVKLGHVAIDGTKMKANASKHEAKSYDRLISDTERLRAEVDGWMARADVEDAADDAEHGPYDPLEEIRLRNEKLAKMKVAIEALRKETAAGRARKLRAQAEELRRKAELPTTSLKKQAEFRTVATKRDGQASLFDTGYFSEANVRFAEHMGTEPVIAVGKQRNDGSQEPASTHKQWNTPTQLAMRATLATPRGRARYARRKATVEPVFGQIRTSGFRQFSFRGLFKNRCEWAFVALAHNLKKLFRAQAALAAPA